VSHFSTAGILLAVISAAAWVVPSGITAAEESMSVFQPAAKLTVEACNGVGGEGPAWDPRLGLFTSGNGDINRLAADGTVSVARKAAGTNGLLFDPEGRLLACEQAARRITRTLADGTRAVLTENFEGRRYNSPNDLSLDSRGRIYFSDPRYGPRDDLEQRDSEGEAIEGVYRIDPDGTVARVIGREVGRANGVLVSADDRTLYVADNVNDIVDGPRKLWRFDLRADGTVVAGSRRLLHDWGRGRGPDGIKQDMDGRLYVAAGLNRPNPPAEPADDVKGGIYVFSGEGRLLEFLQVPTDEVTNCCFGGDDLKTLFITAGGVIYSIRTTTAGRVTWPAG